jgi:hypothetical protein
MTPTKELFLKRTEMRNNLLAIAKQDWFHEALIYVSSEIFSGSGITPEFVKGANAFKDTLLTIADDDEALPYNISSGLCHDIDEPNRRTEKA